MERKTKIDVSPQLENHIVNILDTFSGADNGAKFYKFRLGIEYIEKQYLKGDVSARKLIKMVTDFSKLLDVLAKE